MEQSVVTENKKREAYLLEKESDMNVLNNVQGMGWVVLKTCSSNVNLFHNSGTNNDVHASDSRALDKWGTSSEAINKWI